MAISAISGASGAEFQRLSNVYQPQRPQAPQNAENVQSAGNGNSTAAGGNGNVLESPAYRVQISEEGQNLASKAQNDEENVGMLSYGEGMDRSNAPDSGQAGGNPAMSGTTGMPDVASLVGTERNLPQFGTEVLDERARGDSKENGTMSAPDNAPGAEPPNISGAPGSAGQQAGMQQSMMIPPANEEGDQNAMEAADAVDHSADLGRLAHQREQVERQYARAPQNSGSTGGAAEQNVGAQSLQVKLAAIDQQISSLQGEG
jgi:hypothetical protein